MLCDLARRTPYRGGLAAEDPTIRQKLAAYSAACLTLKINAYRNAEFVARTGIPGPQGSLLKLGWSELDQKVKELAAEILGPQALLLGDEAPDHGHWSHEVLWSRAATIYAGTSEVQRNIISDRVLRLPRS